jgi:tRNA (mo5U34)-methyltransferase
MSDPGAIEARRRIDFSKELAAKGWYHSFELPDGTFIDGFMTVEKQKRRYAQFPIPENLHGKRLLDIGAWDGWFSFEAARHGADVTAIDCVELPTFLDVRARLGALASNVDYRIMDFYELPAAGLGKFDIVFFLGVLYHVRHPLLALEIVCALTRDVAIVDSFVTDPDDWQEHASEIPTMEFYEMDELGNQFGNWVGPTVTCLLAMCRAAGFARVELLGTVDHHAVVGCYRKWEPEPAEPAGDVPEVLAIENARSNGINLSTKKSDEYLAAVFRTSREAVTPEILRLEVNDHDDDFGAAALFVSRESESPSGNVWRATFPLPPGLGPGWHTVRLRFRDSGFGREFRIAVDVPPAAVQVDLREVFDGLTWTKGEVRVGDRAFLSCWVRGLPENADRANVRAFLGNRRLETDYVGEPDAHGYRQINAVVLPNVAQGDYEFRVECAGLSSNTLPVAVRIQSSSK